MSPDYAGGRTPPVLAYSVLHASAGELSVIKAARGDAAGNKPEQRRIDFF
jgi:hypothetical protein